MEAVSREHGVIVVQIGSQRVRQVHAHLLRGLSLLHHVYITGYALYKLVQLVEAVSRDRCILEVQIGSQRVRQVHCAFSEWVVAAPPCLSHELCTLLTGTHCGSCIS